MSRLAPSAAESSQYTKQQILDKLTYWREHLLEHKQGVNTILVRHEIDRELDRWLDALLALKER